MKTKLLLCTTLLSLSGNVFAGIVAGGVDPSSVKIKVYSVDVSKTADCASPVNVFTSAAGTTFDFVTSPTLGGGNPADGTYNCVMLTMSSLLKVTPATTTGSCTAGTEFSTGVCNTGQFSDTLTAAGTTAHTACTAGDDKVTLYLQTGTTQIDGGGPFLKPTTTTDHTNGFKLAAPFVVAGTVVGTFVIDFTAGVVSGGGTCGLNPPLFSFR